jgi:formylglycine-generating enzyme required for sulfatase activity
LVALTARAAAPEGMVWIPGGEFWMGCGDEAVGMEDCRPRHRVYIDGLWMDNTPVTNDQFAEFTRATGYRTVAERKPDARGLPGVPRDKLVPGSIVFQPTPTPVPLDDQSRWWSYVPGAFWKQPEGPGSDIKQRARHPVVHMAWEDADAYCKWRKKRLPTEAELEGAARGGLDRKKYAWGDELSPKGKVMANVWRGQFPCEKPGERAHRTSEVGSFPANAYGMYDVAGNVWEWTSDWYRPDYFKTVSGVTRNPTGPDSSFDPTEPGVPKRVQKGGSFLCSKQFCTRYLVGSRGRAEPNSSASHTGFRCAK